MLYPGVDKALHSTLLWGNEFFGPSTNWYSAHIFDVPEITVCFRSFEMADRME